MVHTFHKDLNILVGLGFKLVAVVQARAGRKVVLLLGNRSWHCWVGAGERLG